MHVSNIRIINTFEKPFKINQYANSIYKGRKFLLLMFLKEKISENLFSLICLINKYHMILNSVGENFHSKYPIKVNAINLS